MFARSITRLTLALIIVVASLLLVTSFTVTAAAPSADLIVNPGESIQAAIDAANDGDTIIINAGDYTQSLTLSKPVSLTGVNSDTTIIHAVAGQRVLTVTGATITNSVVISGLTFTGGDVTGGTVPDCTACGGGIYVTHAASPRIQNSLMHDNRAIEGGGLFAESSPLELVDTQLSSNFADHAGGAYIYGGTVSGGKFVGNVAKYDAGGLASFSDTTVTGTEFISNAALHGNGGGLIVTFGLAAVINARFEHNSAEWRGGGLIADDQLSQLVISQTDFISNTAEEGGGVNINAEFAMIVGGRFEANHATLYGGGLSTRPGGGGLGHWLTLTLSRTQFLSNTANGAGAGAYVDSYVYITDTLFAGNHCTQPCFSNEGGGGLSGSSEAYVSNSYFIDNSSAGAGGGLRASLAHITNSRFERNTSAEGGGLWVTHLDLSNSVLLDNYAATHGGAIALPYVGQSSIVNTLLIRNQAGESGAAISLGTSAVWSDAAVIKHSVIDGQNVGAVSAIAILRGSLDLSNTLIANHAIGINNAGGTVTEDYNLFYGNITDTVGVTMGAHSLVGDPRFIDPAHDDYHLALGSAAIDHGVDAVAYTDLDGNVRPIGPGFDIGAYEYQGPTYRAFLPVLRR